MIFAWNIFLLSRPKHWLKNLLAFTAAIFAFKFDWHSLVQVLWAFAAFSLFASAIYVLNDIFDVRRDKLHPKKKFRPIASGQIKIWQAYIFFCALLAGGVFVSFYLNHSIFLVCIIYFLINLIYSFGLKHVPIVDVMIVSLGFVLRVIVGAYAIGVSISHWLLLCTFFLSLFLAFGKRKNEMDILDSNSRSHRRSISQYTDGFIGQMLAVTAGISIVFYSLYTIDSATISHFGSEKLVYTTPIVVFAILRYFHQLYNEKHGGDPVTIFLKDGQMIVAFIIWIGSILIIHRIP